MAELTGRDEHGAENSINDDIYYQVMPLDRHRRVRQQGRGVTPSSSNHNGAALRIEQLENELAEMRRQTQEKEEQRQQEFDQLTRSFEHVKTITVRMWFLVVNAEMIASYFHI
ncbi:hypothetical protein FRX31_015239 [Thalictrum thalictroides]|uniref:Uncharacterized protein n=1 Tax=Thalictrum thalictroides TaxID=46969 RepID=A0A7J6WCL4_THATH|nr:hypothetical protein FRX31_015239 [Thalictrum thalictroides]